MGATLYEPINVYKPLAPNVGVVDGSFEYFTVAGIRMPMPFTTRMTVARLDNGDLFLHSPIAFDESLAVELQRLGIVRYLISPNQWHYAHVGEWQRAFPEAIAWASPGVRRRARARQIDVHFTRELEEEAPAEWHDEIDQTLVPGGIFKEFVFFHKVSRTLILTDTIMNLELDKITEPWRTATKITGMCVRRTVKSSSACGCPSCFKGGRRRRRFRRFGRGDHGASCSVTGAVSMQIRTRWFAEYSDEPAGALRAVVALTHRYAKEFRAKWGHRQRSGARCDRNRHDDGHHRRAWRQHQVHDAARPHRATRRYCGDRGVPRLGRCRLITGRTIIADGGYN